MPYLPYLLSIKCKDVHAYERVTVEIDEPNGSDRATWGNGAPPKVPPLTTGYRHNPAGSIPPQNATQ